MGALDTRFPTLLDISKRLDPNGKIDKIVEQLNLTNEFIDDMVFLEGNLATGHKTTVRTGLPSATWRKLNYGVQPSKSSTKQVTDTCGMLEAYAEVDKALADLNGNTGEFRLSEDAAFLEAMNQNFGSTVLYGDTDVTPERFMGLAPRFDSLSAPNASQIIDAGGTGVDNTSVWLVVWGPNTAHGIYPKGSMAGFQQKDLGEETLLDPNGGRYQGYRTHYKWDCGLTVRDWRYIVRICNIDYSNLQTAGDGTDNSPNLLKYMALAVDMIPNMGMGRAAFYVNRKVASYLRVKLLTANNMFLTLEDYMGKAKVLQFMGIPIRRIDESILLNTESRIT